MSDRPLRIGIDVRYLSHGLVGGVHTYVARLVPALIAGAPGDTFVLYGDTKKPLEIAPPAGVEVRLLPWRRQASSIWNDHTLASRMDADHIDVAFFPTNYGFGPARAASVVTVHDAINLLPLSHTLVVTGHKATLRSNLMTVYLHWTTVRAVRRATRLVTMSGYSRETIVAACSRRAEEIDVVHHGAPPVVPLTPAAIADAARANGITTRYVLADGLKNPGVVLRAAARLPEAVRQAVSLAINRDSLVANVLEGSGSAATGVYPSFFPFADPTAYPYDPTQAGALLEAAGWALGGLFQLDPLVSRALEIIFSLAGLIGLYFFMRTALRNEPIRG